MTGVTIERTDPPADADETATLRGFLTYQRDTLRMKTDGLTSEQLSRPHPPSTMTLGGLLKHLALVEDWWLSCVLLGNEYAEPFRSVDWDADPDWEWHTAADDSPEELRALFDRSVDASDAILDAATDWGTLSRRERPRGETFSLRWIVAHMIEEYARHNGHADLIRESIDGATGE